MAAGDEKHLLMGTSTCGGCLAYWNSCMKTRGRQLEHGRGVGEALRRTTAAGTVEARRQGRRREARTRQQQDAAGTVEVDRRNNETARTVEVQSYT
ncbi:hypothetical protein Scep_024733 [Stephania cephalantha]|uniref:Uncharacterized protein n=1 Tax=Stephania cephalantha TaxID=152367 RepID=A0AAP0F4D9_9MAGN